MTVTLRPYGDAVANEVLIAVDRIQQCGAYRPKRRGIRTDGQHTWRGATQRRPVVANERCSIADSARWYERDICTTQWPGRLRLRAPDCDRVTTYGEVVEQRDGAHRRGVNPMTRPIRTTQRTEAIYDPTPGTFAATAVKHATQ